MDANSSSAKAAYTAGNVKNDFISSSRVLKLGSQPISASHYVHFTKEIAISDSDAEGKHILSFGLDAHIDPAAVSLAAEYVKYSFTDVEVNFSCTSAQGSTSGAVQVAWFTDPANNGWDTTATAFNLTRAVRQSSSVMLRPRQSNVLDVVPNGELYTLKLGDARLWSFGYINAVVRAKAEASHAASWQMTIKGRLNFHTATFYQNESTLFKQGVLIDNYELCDDVFKIEVAFPEYPKYIDFNFKDKINLFVKAKNELGDYINKMVQLDSISLVRDEDNFCVYKCVLFGGKFKEILSTSIYPKPKLIRGYIEERKC